MERLKFSSFGVKPEAKTIEIPGGYGFYTYDLPVSGTALVSDFSKKDSARIQNALASIGSKFPKAKELHDETAKADDVSQNYLSFYDASGQDFLLYSRDGVYRISAYLGQLDKVRILFLQKGNKFIQALEGFGDSVKSRHSDDETTEELSIMDSFDTEPEILDSSEFKCSSKTKLSFGYFGSDMPKGIKKD